MFECFFLGHASIADGTLILATLFHTLTWDGQNAQKRAITRAWNSNHQKGFITIGIGVENFQRLFSQSLKRFGW
jgi:hypothetical protein